jgi:hypothetical protein
MTTRREQVREAIARHRKRRKRGFFWRPILVTKAQLDQLEERGYLNPSDAAPAPTNARRLRGQTPLSLHRLLAIAIRSWTDYRATLTSC